MILLRAPGALHLLDAEETCLGEADARVWRADS